MLNSIIKSIVDHLGAPISVPGPEIFAGFAVVVAPPPNRLLVAFVSLPSTSISSSATLATSSTSSSSSSSSLPASSNAVRLANFCCRASFCCTFRVGTRPYTIPPLFKVFTTRPPRTASFAFRVVPTTRGALPSKVGSMTAAVREDLRRRAD